MKRLAILSTHPIQYNAPLFRMLAQEESIDLKVFYSKKTEQVRVRQRLRPGGDMGRAVDRRLCCMNPSMPRKNGPQPIDGIHRILQPQRAARLRLEL